MDKTCRRAVWTHFGLYTPLNVQIYAIFLKDRAFTLFLLKGSRFARTCAPPFVRTFALTVRVFKAPNATSNGGGASRVIYSIGLCKFAKIINISSGRRPIPRLS